MKQPTPTNEYRVNIFVDGRWNVTHKRRTGYDHVSATRSVYHGQAADAASAKRAAEDAITNDRAKLLARERHNTPCETFTVQA